MPRLILLVCLLVPCVSGHKCCMPGRLTGTVSIGPYLHPSKFLMDFSKKKLIAEPESNHDDLDVFLIDFGANTILRRYKSGLCTISDFGYENAFERCIPEDAIDLGDQWGIRAGLGNLTLWKFNTTATVPTETMLYVNNNNNYCIPLSVNLSPSSMGLTMGFDSAVEPVDASNDPGLDIDQNTKDCSFIDNGTIG